jgi:hypothetical protein
LKKPHQTPHQTHLVGASRLKELTGVRSWYSWNLLLKRGVILPALFADESGRELWSMAQVQSVKDSIADYQARQAAVRFNAPISV